MQVDLTKKTKIKNVDPGDVKIQIIPPGQSGISDSEFYTRFNRRIAQFDDSGKKNKKPVR